MSNIDELIEWLRDCAGTPGAVKMCMAAADALEELQSELERVKLERDTLIKRTSGECWTCIRRYECNSRRGPHSRCWGFDSMLLRED